MFDLIAGTSTGGILAAALGCPATTGRPRYGAEELIDLYEHEGPQIFDRSLIKRATSADGLIDEKYDSAGLEGALSTYIGDVRLSQALTPVLLTAYDIERRQAFFFRTERARAEPDLRLLAGRRGARHVGRAHLLRAGPGHRRRRRRDLRAGGRRACSPPTPPCAPGPTWSAPAARPTSPSWRRWAPAPPSARSPTRTPAAGALLEWARPLIDVLFSGAAETVDFQLGQLLGDRYVRLQERLETASDDLDDASRGEPARPARRGRPAGARERRGHRRPLRPPGRIACNAECGSSAASSPPGASTWATTSGRCAAGSRARIAAIPRSTAWSTCTP